MGEANRNYREHLQHEIHSSDAALAGPQGENEDGKIC